MKRNLALLCTILLLLALAAGCQPTAETLRRQGVEALPAEEAVLQARLEQAILAGETSFTINLLGRQRAVEQMVTDTLARLREGESYLAQRFLADYGVQFGEAWGYVPVAIWLTPKDEALLLDLIAAQGATPQPVLYGPEQMEALLMDMMQDKTPVAIRFFQEQDLDQLNQQIHGDVVQISKTNYAYGYLVENGEWSLQTCRQPDGQGYIALELTLTYQQDALPLSQIPVAQSGLEMIECLIQQWEEGAEKATLILEGIRPDEATLFAWINTAEVNSATLACEGDSIWYEILENPSDRQIGRYWLEFGASQELIAAAQAELDLALAQEVSALEAQVAGLDSREAYRAVYQRVMELTEYDDEIRDATEAQALTQEMQILRSAYGALVAGRSVCTGYARAFQALCNGLGLPCWTVNGYQDGAGHAWNMVRLDGETLYVDCTFGDTGGRPDRYFLFDQETLEARRYEMDAGFVVPW